ncbi:hypothetical protein AJ80_07598 [Polytolypa hystricis UAMH7299]|uniref:SGNH hydrolase-type esterase domain-containing protein n=1 Tax=Polytolypa hystricis (strain UAMH7299) TaxID=1447883 RepID=A0A2B7XMR5_POLH7|nr:hypothetical protein AJ80_07598 [Polytolypa hystricis UAMH7299]
MKGTVFSELLALALSVRVASAGRGSAFGLRDLKSLVTFGDSYTDESRLGYFIENNGEAPPVGWESPASDSTASGGLSWARIVSNSAGAELYNYAISGGVCSNKVSPRHFDAINAPFPDVEGYEIPAFIADSHHKVGKKPFLNLPRHETVYAMWIGTNDVGNSAFLTDEQIKGKTLLDYVDTIYSSFDKLYKNGARYFVLMNLAPLHLLPQYAGPELDGPDATPFWPNKAEAGNATAFHERIKENVVTLNELFKYKTPVEVTFKRRYKGANFALFDTSALITDIYNNPNRYLKGTPNVRGWINNCDLTGGNCEKADCPESYLWFDELHPSVRTSEIIAENFLAVLNGKSKYATYYSS